MKDYWEEFPEEYERCIHCSGTGRRFCTSCRGRGRRITYTYGRSSHRESSKPCIFCSGTGFQRCTVCHGKGSVKKVGRAVGDLEQVELDTPFAHTSHARVGVRTFDCPTVAR